MGNPLLLVDNLFSIAQYPNHTIAGNEEATGHEAFRLADGRRSALDYWASTTANQAAYVTATHDRLRAFNCIVIDRGHNLSGLAIKLLASDDSFATTETVLDLTLPTAATGGSIDSDLGVVTEEGAWIKRFPTRAAYGTEFYVGAMGAGLVPNVVGLWVGLAVELNASSRPWAEDSNDLVHDESRSDVGWVGAGSVNAVRSGQLILKTSDGHEYERLRYHVESIARRRPFWLVYDVEQADRAVLAIRPPGRFGLELPGDWGWRAGAIPWVEHEALAP